DKSGADEGKDELTLLVRSGIERGHKTPPGPAVERPGLDHLARIGHGIPGKDRFEPPELAKSRRGSKLGDRFTPAATLVILAADRLDPKPHPKRDSVPARGAQPPEMRLACGMLIEMKGLWVKTRRKRLDLI